MINPEGNKLKHIGRGAIIDPGLLLVTPVISDDPATPNVETVSESDFQRRCQLRQPDTAVSKLYVTPS